MTRDLSPTMLKKIKTYLLESIKNNKISSDNVRISITAFGESSMNVKALEDMMKDNVLRSLVDSIRFIGGVRKTSNALKYVKDNHIVTGNVRPEPKRTIVLITTGPDLDDNSDLMKVTNNLRGNLKVKFTFVIVGDRLDTKTEIEKVKGEDDFVIIINHDGEITDIHDDIDFAISKLTGIVVVIYKLEFDNL